MPKPSLFSNHSDVAPYPSQGCACYRPQRSCGQGYVFTRVCDSVHRGFCLSACWDTTPYQGDPPAKETPCQGHTPCQGYPPAKETPLPRRHPPGSRLRHTVRILLECILVFLKFSRFSTERKETWSLGATESEV